VNVARLPGQCIFVKKCQQLVVEHDSVERQCPRGGQIRDVADERFGAEVAFAPAVCPLEERERILEQPAEIFEGDRALSVRRPQSSLRLFLHLDHAGSLQQRGPLVMAREQGIDDQRVDELSRELRFEQRRIDRRRQRGIDHVSEIVDRAQHDVQRVEQGDRGLDIDLPLIEKIRDRLCRRSQCRQR
jgi:hypothetical protein